MRWLTSSPYTKCGICSEAVMLFTIMRWIPAKKNKGLVKLIDPVATTVYQEWAARGPLFPSFYPEREDAIPMLCSLQCWPHCCQALPLQLVQQLILLKTETRTTI